jgi:hypothetical protein
MSTETTEFPSAAELARLEEMYAAEQAKRLAADPRPIGRVIIKQGEPVPECPPEYKQIVVRVIVPVGQLVAQDHAGQHQAADPRKDG